MPGTGIARTGSASAPAAMQQAATAATVRIPRISESSARATATVEPDMSHTPAERAGFLQHPTSAVMGGLVALHILVLVVIVARAASLAPADADVARANRIATSPAIAYRNFPVEFMPVQTLFDRVLGSGDVADAARRIALVAFLADMAAAVALAWGWGRRQSRHLPAARTAAAVVPVPAVRPRRGRTRRVVARAAPAAARRTRRRSHSVSP